MPDAIASNADTLVSIGGVQSNHTRMVAAVAAKLGMKCVLIQESWVPHEDAVYDRVGNIMLSRIMGAETRMVDAGFDIGIRESWQAALDDVQRQGRQALRHPGRRIGAQVGRPRLCRVRRGGAGAGGRDGPALRLYRRVHGHRLDPCRHGGGLRRGRSRTQRHRHRCILHPGADQGAGARHRPQHVCPGRRARHRGGRHRPAGGLRLSGLRRAVEGNAGGHPPCRAAGGHDHRPGLRGQVDAGHDRPDPEGILPHRVQRCSTRIWAAARRSTATATRSATAESRQMSLPV